MIEKIEKNDRFTQEKILVEIVANNQANPPSYSVVVMDSQYQHIEDMDMRCFPDKTNAKCYIEELKEIFNVVTEIKGMLMTGKEFAELLATDANQIVKIMPGFNPEGDYEIAPFMMARVKSFSEFSDEVGYLILDFTEFEDYNKSVAQPNFYDANGNPALVWMQTPKYQNAANYPYYLFEHDRTFLEIVTM